MDTTTNMEGLLSKLESRGIKKNGETVEYIKTKVYLPLEVGESVGKEIGELKELARKHGKRVPNDLKCIHLLHPDWNLQEKFLLQLKAMTGEASD